MSAPAPTPSGESSQGLTEVKYSLPQLLEELKAERTASTFAMEKLDQTEIGKLFKAKATRRAKPKN
jgi:hypothetical protein